MVEKGLAWLRALVGVPEPQVRFPALTWQLKTICNSVFGGPTFTWYTCRQKCQNM